MLAFVNVWRRSLINTSSMMTGKEIRMTAEALSSALTNVGTVVTSAVGIITDNTILMVMFAGGLLAVGFRAIKWAKRAVR